jgi:DHA1 family tetracycline resistance protein-like MFS transporter
MFEGVFSLYSQKHLGLESDQTGYLLAYVGILVAFIQGGAIGRLAHRFGEGRLIVGASAVLVPSLVGWAYAPTIGAVVLVLAPVSLSIGILSATINSVLTKKVQRQEVGGILGLASAIGSITRIIGPIAGAILLDAVGAWAPGVFGALLVSWLLIYAWRYFSQSSGVSPLAGVESERSRI